jgi:hypothetical protein
VVRNRFRAGFPLDGNRGNQGFPNHWENMAKSLKHWRFYAFNRSPAGA